MIIFCLRIQQCITIGIDLENKIAFAMYKKIALLVEGGKY